MLIKMALLSVALLTAPSNVFSEDYFALKKRGGLEVRINPFKGEPFNYSFDFSASHHNLETLEINGGPDLDDFLKSATTDLGLSQNRKLNRINLINSAEFTRILSLSELPGLTNLSIRLLPHSYNWDFLVRFPRLNDLSIECADNTDLTNLLQNVSLCQNLKNLQLSFDDYISERSTTFTKKQKSLLCKLTHLKTLSINYYRFMPLSEQESAFEYYINLSRELRKKLTHTHVSIKLIEEGAI